VENLLDLKPIIFKDGLLDPGVFLSVYFYYLKISSSYHVAKVCFSCFVNKVLFWKIQHYTHWIVISQAY